MTERCDWVDWRNGPYVACGQEARTQLRGTWLCHDDLERHITHIAHIEYPRVTPDCSCLTAMITPCYRNAS